MFVCFNLKFVEISCRVYRWILHLHCFQSEEAGDSYWINLEQTTNCMGRKFIATGILSMLSFVSSFAETQTKVLIEEEETTREYMMYGSGKMYFSGDQLIVDTLGNDDGVKVNLGDIKKMTFSLVEVSPTGIEKVVAQSPSVSLFPTISKDFIRVKIGREGEFPYFIYSVNGNLVDKGNVSDGGKLDVSSLVKGVYLLKIGDTYIKISKL